MSDVPITRVEGPLDDSPDGVTSLLRGIRLLFADHVPAWHLDLTACSYIGPYATALLVATCLDARKRGVSASVALPARTHPDTFLYASGAAHFLTGAAPVEPVPDLVTQVRVQTHASFNDADPIVELIFRHATLNPEVEEYLRICVSEVVQNVEDHARSAIGCVTCALFQPELQEIRIAIADAGSGIGTTLRRRYLDISDATAALQRVIVGGYSAKSRPNNMGVGMSNLNLITLQLRGELIIVTEDAVANAASGVVPFARPLDVRYPGTAVFFKVPLS